MYTLVSRETAEHNVTFQAFHTNQRLPTGTRGGYSKDPRFDQITVRDSGKR